MKNNPNKSGTKNPKLLIVDDNADNILVIGKILNELEINTYNAHSEKEALTLIKQHDFFLILMDVEMSKMDGIETINQLKTNKTAQQIPIIFISSISTDTKIITDGYNLGVVDYIYKPINPHILKSKINIFLNISLQHILLETEVKERIKAEQLQDDFVSVVSHELRTPLTAIQGSIGLLAGGLMGELTKEGQNMLDIAMSNCNRLLVLVNDLLDIQKIDQGKIVLQCTPIEINALIKQSIIENSGYSEKLNVHYEFIEPNINPILFIDKQRIAQVLANLLSNAAKFTPKGETILITVKMKDENTVRISVIDPGSGIPKEFQSKVFSKFAQADSSANRSKGGTGLGLSISKSIIDNHKGQIDFISTEGDGTTFFFDLPLYSEQLVKVS